MPARLTSADRKIIWIAVCLLAALTFVAVVSAPAPEAEPSSVPSSYLSTPGGARAAFLLLRRLGMKAQRWEEPPFRLNDITPSATFVLAQPVEAPSHAERSALRQFVANGGRVLFCGGNMREFFPEVHIQRLENPPSVGISILGQGEVIWWADAAPLTNASLTSDHHLALFLNSVGLGTRTLVIWDEYFHGERGSLWVYIGRVPAIRWALLPIAMLVCAAIFTFSRRRGPVIAPTRVSRLSPLEFVDSLGNLYRKAKATSVPVETSARELRLQLLTRLTLPVDTPDADLARAASIRLAWNEQELRDVLERAHTAMAAKSQAAGKALELVQALQAFSAKASS